MREEKQEKHIEVFKKQTAISGLLVSSKNDKEFKQIHRATTIFLAFFFKDFMCFIPLNS